MNETHWFQVCISCWRLETVSVNVHETPMECFEYTVAPRRQPSLYHDQFNEVFPMLIHYLFVSLTRPPGYPDRNHSPAVTKLLIQHRVTRPHILSVSLRWKIGDLSAAICSVASCCPETSRIQGCGRAWLRASADSANVTYKIILETLLEFVLPTSIFSVASMGVGRGSRGAKAHPRF